MLISLHKPWHLRNVLGHRVFVPTSHHLEYGVNTLDCSLTAFKLMGVYIRTGPSPLEPIPLTVLSFSFRYLPAKPSTKVTTREDRPFFGFTAIGGRITRISTETLVSGKSATLAPTRSQRERWAVWRSRARHVHKYLSVKSPFP
jgi:hypothetical protein